MRLNFPHVEVFRSGSDSGYAFKEKVTTLEAAVSTAMPNANPRVRGSPIDRNPDPAGYVLQLAHKWRATLAAAAFYTAADCLVDSVLPHPTPLGRGASPRGSQWRRMSCSLWPSNA